MIRHLIETFSQQIVQSLEAGQRLQLTPPLHEIYQVVISGMGSAGTGAQLAATLTADQLAVPVFVHQHYQLPAFVNAHTLFIGASFSGKTEETLAALEVALAKGATVVILAGGGTLAELAGEKGLPLIKLPLEGKQESALITFYTIQLLFLFHGYSLIDNFFVAQLHKLITLVNEREAIIQEGARNLAEILTGNLPIICGDAKLYPVMAHFAQQINRYAKQFAHVYVLPGINYDELSGFARPEAIIDQSVVMLVQTDYDHPRVQHRLAISRTVFTVKAAAIVEVLVRYGDSPLEQYFYLIHLFDWTAFYLAGLNGADPQDSQLDDYLKDELSKPF